MFVSAGKRTRMKFRKKIVMCSHDLPFCITIKCVMVGRRSHHASLTQAKRDLKKEKIWSLNDAWKGYLKTWDRWNSQSFHRKGDSQRPIWTPGCKGQRSDVRWVMAYGHKTQSFIKNGSQQKCLNKALIRGMGALC